MYYILFSTLPFVFTFCSYDFNSVSKITFYHDFSLPPQIIPRDLQAGYD